MTDTLSWLSVECEVEGELYATVGFADILKAVSGDLHSVQDPDRATSSDSTKNLKDVLSGSDLDACDGILAEERLQEAEWVDWTDVKRELLRSS